ncbi:thermostable hemolysin [Pseudidiomarina sp. GXY010]|uniref:Thermostable hemolysin n=1 Tax=Pseudidiomarina fusca TaxID=2965078 RepID=A0ABU3KVF1_9GAMM|nr:thermostable hemolysin [Pseudidiomarina sp. GXY010]MDT7525473.1 thermostable hemolysin [Pseudidiomarina sp. GXY010]
MMLSQFILPNHPKRNQVERFICDRYWLHFQACLERLPPLLLALFEDEEVVAGCAIQLAEQGPMFSEYYLPTAAQNFVTTRVAATVSRQQLAEIGSLAVADGRYLTPLFSAVYQAATALNKNYLLFTVTRFLQLKLQRLGIQTQPLGLAHEQQLPSTLQGLWGNYYQQQPQVILVAVNQGWPLTTQVPATAPHSSEALSC